MDKLDAHQIATANRETNAVEAEGVSPITNFAETPEQAQDVKTDDTAKTGEGFTLTSVAEVKPNKEHQDLALVLAAHHAGTVDMNVATALIDRTQLVPEQGEGADRYKTSATKLINALSAEKPYLFAKQAQAATPSTAGQYTDAQVIADSMTPTQRLNQRIKQINDNWETISANMTAGIHPTNHTTQQ